MPLVIPSVYRHVQDTPADVWTVQHNLGGNGSQGVPMVDVLWDNGSGLEKIIPSGITRIDANSLTISFNAPRSGQAIVLV